MRDMHIQAIDNKIYRIRTYKRIGKMIFWTLAIVLVITAFSIIDSETSDLSNKTMQNACSVENAEKIVESEDLGAKTGMFIITHYANDIRCCGKTDGITATGTQATVGRTVAVDPEIIPLGSKVIIDGKEYIAEDVGGAIKGNRIDIFVASYDEAIQRGKIEREVRYGF